MSGRTGENVQLRRVVRFAPAGGVVGHYLHHNGQVGTLVEVEGATGEAALAMGATRWQTVRRVLLPAARNGLLAAVLLGVGRAVGETMAVLMETWHAVHIPNGLLDSVRTLTANIAAELGEAPAGSDHYRVLFLTGTLLFLITFVVNFTADLAIRGVRRR